MGRPAQIELNEQIAESADILIGIFGTRIGTPTERHVSGTVEEILNHVQASGIAKVYFSDAPVQPSRIDKDQYTSLQDFRQTCRHLGLYASYDDLASFRRDFKQHIDIELNAPRFQLMTHRQLDQVVAGSTSHKVEGAKPVDVSIKTFGDPGKQEVEIRSSEAIKLTKIEYMHSTEACIAEQCLTLQGSEIHAEFDYRKLVELNNSSRSDRNLYDSSGPAKLRLTVRLNGKIERVVLPVHLQSKTLNGGHWITLTGATNVML